MNTLKVLPLIDSRKTAASVTTESASTPMSPYQRKAQRIFYVALFLAVLALATNYFLNKVSQRTLSATDSATPNPILSTK